MSDEDDFWQDLHERLAALSGDRARKLTPAREVFEELVDELGDAALTGKHLPAVPTRREIRRLIQAARPPRDRLIMRLLYATGVRVGELVKLQAADVRSDLTVFIRSGKEDKDRYVCVDPATMRMLERWIAADPNRESLLDISVRQVNRLVKEYAGPLGLVEKYEQMNRSFSPHSFRHAFATHSYENGMDLYVLKKLMGHEFLTTTEIYVATSMRYARKVYRKTNELCRKRRHGGAESHEGGERDE